MKYYTETKQKITERIQDGRTEFFSKDIENAREKAAEYAKERHSYYYSVFSIDEESAGINKRHEFAGYGVPK